MNKPQAGWASPIAHQHSINTESRHMVVLSLVVWRTRVRRDRTTSRAVVVPRCALLLEHCSFATGAKTATEDGEVLS
jgi:hypothetical protein